MNIILFAHPPFFQGQSMSRFAKMITDGLQSRRHKVQVWSPRALFFNLVVPNYFKKWLGYIDQFIIFPRQVRKRLRHIPANTLFVFVDQALGPWFPLVKSYPHVIHCHDLLAQRSALNEFSENRTSWTGRIYQKFIYKGYSEARFFLSVSHKTREDLHRFLPVQPLYSDVIYNGLNQPFQCHEPEMARSKLQEELKLDLRTGYILHLGGNAWYKNRIGVIEIYNAWRQSCSQWLPLLMIGEDPLPDLYNMYKQSPFRENIYLLGHQKDELVRYAYAGATAFLFPSIAEGFGWPIAEAMASGCPVITTNEPPMVEVAGSAGFFIRRKPSLKSDIKGWAMEAAQVLNQVITMTSEERQRVINRGLENVRRFNAENTLDEIERFYLKVLKHYELQKSRNQCAEYSVK